MKKMTKKQEQEILSRFAQYLQDKQDGKHDLTSVEIAWTAALALSIAVILTKIIEWL